MPPASFLQAGRNGYTVNCAGYEITFHRNQQVGKMQRARIETVELLASVQHAFERFRAECPRPGKNRAGGLCGTRGRRAVRPAKKFASKATHSPEQQMLQCLEGVSRNVAGLRCERG